MKEHKPIKRDKAFVPFSKDHHFSLLLAWKIRNDLANKVKAEHICSYVLEFFSDNLEQHFKEEEELIFCKLSTDDALRKQAENEHRKIYLLMESIQQNTADKELLNEFANTLETHIRFEERTLFNHLQQNMKSEELEEVFLIAQENDDDGKHRKLFMSHKNIEGVQ